MASTTIFLRVVPKGFTKGMSAIGALAVGFKALSGVVSGARKAWNTMEQGMMKSLELGNEYVRAQAQIKNSLSELTENQAAAQKTMKDFAFNMSLTTEASLGQVQTLQAMAINMAQVGDPKVVNDIVMAGMALAAAIPTMDEASAITAITKSYQGITKGTLRAIPGIADMTKEQLKNGEAVKQIIKLYGSGLSAAVDTVSGRFNNLQTVFKDKWLTTIGRGVMEQHRLAKSLEMMTEMLDQLAPSSREAKEFFEGLIDISFKAATAFGQFSEVGINVIGSLAVAVLKFGDWMARGLLKPFELGFKAFRALSADIAQFSEEFDLPEEFTNFAKGAETMYGTIENIIGGLGHTADAVRKTTDVTLDFMGQVNKVLNAGAEAWGNYAGKVEKTKKELGRSDDKDNGAGLGIDLDAVDNALDGIEKQVTEHYNKIDERARKTAEYRVELEQRVSDGINETAKTNYDRRIELTNKVAESMDAVLQERQEYWAQISSNVADTLAGATSNFFNSMLSVADGTKTFAEAMRDMVFQAAKSIATSALTSVINNAVAAATGSASAVSMIPIIGPGLAIAAAAGTLAMVMAYKSRVKQPQKFAAGGKVNVGDPGRDSVLIMARKGEEILSPEESAARERGEMNKGINVNVSPQGILSTVEADRQVNQIWGPAIMRAIRRGQLNLQAA
jgi:hypothetical protein